MIAHKIFADFNNCDAKKRVRLNTRGTESDLKTKNIQLNSGMEILLDDEDTLSCHGIVKFSEEEKIWVAVIDCEKLNK